VLQRLRPYDAAPAEGHGRLQLCWRLTRSSLYAPAEHVDLAAATYVSCSVLRRVGCCWPVQVADLHSSDTPSVTEQQGPSRHDVLAHCCCWYAVAYCAAMLHPPRTRCGAATIYAYQLITAIQSHDPRPPSVVP
jgi:hypothetical protein